jgi:hypothetical protein
MSRLPALPARPKRGMVAHEPQPGFWEFQYVRGGPVLPAAIYRIDHEPGSEGDEDGANMLETPILIANIGYREVDPLKVWGGRRLRSITEAEYSLAMDQLAWDRDFDPSAPVARPKERVDLGTLKPIGPTA